jgi:hypothetical protein
MPIRDSGRRRTGAVESYDGYEIWEYDHGPHEVNDGDADPEWFDEKQREAAEATDEDGDASDEE